VSGLLGRRRGVKQRGEGRRCEVGVAVAAAGGAGFGGPWRLGVVGPSRRLAALWALGGGMGVAHPTHR
jgi:hypothetical protein